jgi:hypothetical protein
MKVNLTGDLLPFYPVAQHSNPENNFEEETFPVSGIVPEYLLYDGLVCRGPT